MKTKKCSMDLEETKTRHEESSFRGVEDEETK